METNPILKSEVAKKALKHTIERVEVFNNGYYPFKIVSVGVGGSCLRTEKPKDIDIFIERASIPKIWDEWRDFKKILDASVYDFYKWSYEKREPEKKMSIERIIQTSKEGMLSVGFNDDHIEIWLKWCRISDIMYGVNHGMRIVDFSESKLLSRFIKNGWNGKRLEFHDLFFDPEGKTQGLSGDLPYVTLWSSKEGLIKPTPQEIEAYFIKEKIELTKDLKNILTAHKSKDGELSLDFPIVYHPTFFFLKEKDEPTRFKKLKNALLKIARSEIKKMESLQIKQSNLPELNTEIRNSLKRFALIGIFFAKLEGLSYFEIKEILATGNVKKSLTCLLTKRLRRRGYLKKDVENLVEKLTMRAITFDFEKFIERWSVD